MSRLDQIASDAEHDLTTRPLGCMLQWGIRHAAAVGDLRSAELHLAHLEGIAKDVRFRKLHGTWTMAQEQVATEVLGVAAPDDVELESARCSVAQATAIVQACATVMELLKRPRPEKAAAKAQLQAVGGGKR